MRVDGRETDKKAPRQQNGKTPTKDPEPIPFWIISLAGLVAAAFYVASLIKWPYFTAVSTAASTWLVYFIYHPDPATLIHHFLSQHEPAILSALLLILFTVLAPEVMSLIAVAAGGCYLLAKLTDSVLV